MSNDVIDCAFHGTSFPATYIGPGTIVGNVKNSLNSDSKIYGYFTSAGNITELRCGFPPRRVKLINTTDGLIWEWHYGMPAANSIKNLLGGSPTSTQDTGSAITIKGDQASGRVQGQDSNVASVFLSAATVGTAKNIAFEIEG
jgi:hypothetical protein